MLEPLRRAEERREGDLYGPHWYSVDARLLSELRTLRAHKPVLVALRNWLWIFAIVKTYLYFPALIYLYPVVIFMIAGRAGVFLQLAHEAAHGLVSKGKFNDWFGNWMACYPIGLDLKGYQEPHLRHHACTNQTCDPVSDSEKYRICDVRNPRLWLLFVKDLFAITALRVRFLYDQPIANQHKKDIADDLEAPDGPMSAGASGGWLSASARKYLSIALVQAVIFAAVFAFNLVAYLFLWITPLVTAHMVLMRVRGIAEHGLGIQLGFPDLERNTRGTFFTRSFGTPIRHYPVKIFNWVERFLIGSLDVYYHHEHHLYPKIPYYNLHRIHAVIGSRVHENNPFVFARGYFDCLWFNVRPRGEIPHPRANFP